MEMQLPELLSEIAKTPGVDEIQVEGKYQDSTGPQIFFKRYRPSQLITPNIVSFPANMTPAKITVMGHLPPEANRTMGGGLQEILDDLRNQKKLKPLPFIWFFPEKTSSSHGPMTYIALPSTARP